MSGKDEYVMKFFSILTVFILLMLVVLSGCVSTESISAAEIKIHTLQSSTDINSYRFTMDMIMATEAYDSEMTMSISADGAVDVINQKIQMEMNSAFSGLMGMNVGFLCYITDDTMYIKLNSLGSEQWIKMDYSEFNATWDSYNQMQMQVELLEYSAVERLPDQQVNNEDCYILKITPDVAKLQEIIMNQQGISNNILQDSYLSYIIKECSIKLWISKSTDYIMRAYEDVSMETTIDDHPASMTMEMTMLFTDYNTPKNIELPEEAENALSFSDFFSTSPA
jgi:outer membrane lipoprotein-sorting protein